MWVHTVCHRGFLNFSADEKSRRFLLWLAHYGLTTDLDMGHNARKSVFRISDKVRFKQQKIESWLVASFDMVLSKKRMTKALIRLCRCAGWTAPFLFANHRRPVFWRWGPFLGLFRKINTPILWLNYTMLIDIVVVVLPGESSCTPGWGFRYLYPFERTWQEQGSHRLESTWI